MTEDKIEFIKRNKQYLILPVDGCPTDEWIDRMVYASENNWKNGGAEAYEMLIDMYTVLKRAGYE